MAVTSVAVLLGLGAGILITWLILRERGSAKRLSKALSDLENKDQSITDLREERDALALQLTASQVKLSEQQAAWHEKLEFKEVLETEFKVLANEILEDKSKRFTELNRSNLESLLVPLGEKIREFRDKVEGIEKDRTSDHGSLKRELELLRTLNQKISEEANNLTSALRGQSKALGNLGQIILEEVLENCGLERDRDFIVQKSLGEEDGKRPIPDVVVNLPNGRHVVIDAKAS